MAQMTDMLALKREGSASYEAEIYQNLNKSNRSFGLKKTEITLSDICRSCQSHCDKWFWRVLKNWFLRHAHTNYHVTALLQTSESKNRKNSLFLDENQDSFISTYNCHVIGTLINH